MAYQGLRLFPAPHSGAENHAQQLACPADQKRRARPSHSVLTGRLQVRIKKHGRGQLLPFGKVSLRTTSGYLSHSCIRTTSGKVPEERLVEEGLRRSRAARELFCRVRGVPTPRASGCAAPGPSRAASLPVAMRAMATAPTTTSSMCAHWRTSPEHNMVAAQSHFFPSTVA